MHFQPLEDIAENMEESGGHHPNVALFNRLLSAAPSPTGFMGGALRRTSAQIQRLRHSPSIDQCTSDDNDDESCKIGGSLPSGLGQETQSTMCSVRDERSTRTPLLEIQFGGEHPTTGEHKRDEEQMGVRGESTAPVSLLPAPPRSSREKSPRPTSSHPPAFLFRQAAHSCLEHCSSQPAINQSRAMPNSPKPSFGRSKMSFLTVPSCEPQRFRSASMGSELPGS